MPQGYLAHKKQPPPLGPPLDPRYSPTVGFYEEVISYERGTPVGVRLMVAVTSQVPCETLGGKSREDPVWWWGRRAWLKALHPMFLQGSVGCTI